LLAVGNQQGRSSSYQGHFGLKWRKHWACVSSSAGRRRSIKPIEPARSTNGIGSAPIIIKYRLNGHQ